MNTETMKYYYENGLWDISRLDKLLAAEKITKAQYDEITGKTDTKQTFYSIKTLKIGKRKTPAIITILFVLAGVSICQKEVFTMREGFCSLLGTLGAAITYLFGGWDTAMITLLILMSIDYVCGLVVAGIFKNSPKTKNGALESRTGWKGLCRKGVTLLIVLVAYRLDLTMGTTIVKDGVVIAFLVNELISIIENTGLMGIPIPAIIINAIDILNRKTGDE